MIVLLYIIEYRIVNYEIRVLDLVILLNMWFIVFKFNGFYDFFYWFFVRNKEIIENEKYKLLVKCIVIFNYLYFYDELFYLKIEVWIFFM